MGLDSSYLPETIHSANRTFDIHYVYGLGWKVIDITASVEIRSSARNGLHATRTAARDALADYIATMQREIRHDQ